jgi:hypothetical protein
VGVADGDHGVGLERAELAGTHPGAGQQLDDEPVTCWLRHKHPHANWKWLRRRYLPGWWPTDGEVVLFDIGKVTVSRYRYRSHHIATPWSWALKDIVA